MKSPTHPRPRKANSSPAARTLLTIACFCLTLAPALAELRLPAIIGDNMVLQRGQEVAVWGWDTPGAEISVTPCWDDPKAPEPVTADADGKWTVKFKTPTRNDEKHYLTIKGTSTVKIDNVLLGEVWICSGQSNMEWPMAATDNAKEDIASAQYPNIRLFTVTKKVSGEPLDDCQGAWLECSPQTLPDFTAVGYMFGRKLHTSLNSIPVGLIDSSWGGTVAEAWTRKGALEGDEDFAPILERLADTPHSPEEIGKLEGAYREKLAEWSQSIAEKDAGMKDGKPQFANADQDDSDWKTMSVPKLWEGDELGSFDGCVWFRKTVEIPDSWQGEDLMLELGPIDDWDTTYVNGKKVGEHNSGLAYQVPRKYKVPAAVVQKGANLIAVRVHDTSGGGGIYGNADQLSIRPTGKAAPEPISLAGDWRYKIGFSQNDLPQSPAQPRAIHANTPTALYNGMIAPLVPYGIRGAIWYQGESNRDRAWQYRKLFPTMIRNWREDFGQGEFPFYWVQIAPYNYGVMEGAGPELREAQMMTLSLPNTGMAVTMDIGNINDIHPRNKKDVGERLARWALAKVHEREKVIFSGPLYKSMKIEGAAIRLSFDCVGKGLVAKGGDLTDFVIAGADKQFVPAKAVIDGEMIVVSAEGVAEPKAARYGWTEIAEPNLFNSAGLPSSSFRTDDWPGVTFGRK